MSNKFKLSNFNRKFLLLILIVILLYTLINGVTEFWRGANNLAIAFNFLNMGSKVGYNQDEPDIQLRDAYLNGLNQMKNSFSWIAFDVILAFITGYFLKAEIQPPKKNR